MVQPAHRSYADSTGRFSTRELEGVWTATPADDDSRRAVLSGSTGSLDWHRVNVPGEWQSHDSFADHAGAVLYRLRLAQTKPVNGERTWIVTNGILDQADIWLDSAYVGDQDDYFLRHAYDVTDLCSLDEEHELIVEVNGAQHAGIRAPIVMKTTGPVAIDAVRVLCRDASDVRAHLRISAELDARTAARATVRTIIDGNIVSERVVPLSSGKNRTEWTVDIVNPRLWWPATLGDQPMSDVTVEVEVDGAISDRYLTSVGLREVSMTNWVLHVNGERVYLKGAFMNMPDSDFGTMHEDAASQPIRFAREIGLDMVRIRRHVAHPATYDAADRLGVLVWQDIPPHPRGARGRRMVTRWAQGLVAQLGHHPSVAVWHHDVIDRAAHRALVTADDTRPVVSHASSLIPSSGRANHRVRSIRDFLGGIGHDLDAALSVIPNLGRFPTDEQWHLFRAQSADAAAALALRRDIETLRRIKYTPSGGFCFPGLRDDSLLTSGGALDASDVAQPSFYALVDACRPVIVVGAGLPATVSAGQCVSFAIHVVSDARAGIDDARVVARVNVDGESETHEWSGSIDADATTFIAALQIDVPPSNTPGSNGLVQVDLQVEAGEHTATNSYVAAIDRPA